MKPKRFLLFQYDQYYPSGGWSDLSGSFNTVEEARICAKKELRTTNEVIDLETGYVVWDGD